MKKSSVHLETQRIAPLPESEWDDETRELLERTKVNGRIFNVFKTLAHHPKLLKRWLVFGNHILGKSTLPAREREILILRTAWLCRAEYEWGQHVLIGREAGLSDSEIERIATGPDASGWSPVDATILRAVDELHANTIISDATWKTLGETFNRQQLLDLIFTVGQYKMLAMALNSLGVQLDEGILGFSTRILDTDRLILRRLTIEDAAFILELVNEPSWLRFIGDKGVRTIADARDHILKGPVASYERFGFGLYLVELKGSGTPIGICGLVKRESLNDADIGFAFLPKYWGRGYAVESAAAVMAYGKSALNLNRIVAITSPDNLGSIKVLEKLGLRF